MNAETPPERPDAHSETNEGPPRSAEEERGQADREKPTLTPEQLERLAQSPPSQTITWPVKNVDAARGDFSPLASRSDAMQSIRARQTVMEDAASVDLDDDKPLLSATMGALEAENSTASMPSARGWERESVDANQAEVTQDLPDRGPVLGLKSATPRPSRGDLLSAGTQRLPQLRTTSSEDALASTDADFVLREVIGRGGQGEVWRAWQTSLSREVAIKRMTKSNGNVLEFLKEAYTSAELDHPNIVPVYDLGRVNDGGVEQPLLAMKMLRGTPWNVLLERDRAARDFSLEEHLARHLPILLDVAHAIAFAHSKGFIHRDLKPHQVMIGDYGEVFLIDWGLAVSLLEDVPTVAREGIPKYHTLRSATACSGTPAYMAPEQTLPTTAQLGYHTDIYLLGGILFELVAGIPPHWCPSGQEAFFMASFNEIHHIPAGCPEELERLIAACLATEPHDRPRTAGLFRLRVQEYLSGSGRRREARHLIEQATAAIEAAGQDYSRLSAADHVLSRAQTLWPENSAIRELNERIVRGYIDAALANNDLVLARVQAGQLPEGAERLGLEAEIDVREQRARRLNRQRRRLVGATVVLLACLAMLGVWAELQRRLAVQRAHDAEYGTYVSNIQFAQMTLSDGRIAAVQEYLLRTPALLRRYEWGHLLARSQVNVAAFPRLSAQPRLAALGPAGEHLVVALDDGTVLSMRGRQGHDISRMTLERQRPTAMVWRDARHVLVGTSRGSLWTLDLEQNAKKEELAPSGESASAILALALHGSRLAVLRANGAVELREPQSLELLPAVSAPALEAIHVTATALHPRGERLLMGDAHGALYVVQLDIGETLLTLPGAHEGQVRLVAWHPTGRLMASVGGQGRPQLRRATDGAILAELNIDAAGISTLLFLPSADTLLTSGSDGTIRFWDASNGALTAAMKVHQGPVSDLRVDAQGEFIVTASADFSARVWNSYLARQFVALPAGGPVTDAVISPDRNRVAAITSEGLLVWLADSRRLQARIDVASAPAQAVAFAPNGEAVAYTTALGEVISHDLLTSTRPSVWKAGRVAATQLVWASLVSGGEPAHVVGMADGAVVMRTGPAMTQLPRHESAVVALDAAPRAGLLISGAVQGDLHVVDARSRRVRLAVPAVAGQLLSAAAISPDGRLIAAGTPAGSIRLVDVSTGITLRRLGGHRGRIHGLAFSPESDRLVSASADHTAKVWDTTTGRELLTLEGHAGPLVRARFSHDGRQILTASQDGTLMIWDSVAF